MEEDDFDARIDAAILQAKSGQRRLFVLGFVWLAAIVTGAALWWYSTRDFEETKKSLDTLKISLASTTTDLGKARRDLDDLKNETKDASLRARLDKLEQQGGSFRTRLDGIEKRGDIEWVVLTGPTTNVNGRHEVKWDFKRKVLDAVAFVTMFDINKTKPRQTQLPVHQITVGIWPNEKSKDKNVQIDGTTVRAWYRAGVASVTEGSLEQGAVYVVIMARVADK